MGSRSGAADSTAAVDRHWRLVRLHAV